MSDPPPGLTAEAVGLVLELLEIEPPLLSGAAAEFCPGPAAELRARGLLVEHDHEAVSASLADHEDTPVQLIWSAQADGFAYFSPAVGLTPVPAERLIRYRVDIARVLSAIVAGLDIAPSRRPMPIIAGHAWELGDVRLGKRPGRTPIWFVRRLWDAAVRRQIAAAIQARPHTSQLVLLTSSRPSREREMMFAGAVVVALVDVAVSQDTLAVSADVLDARLRGVAVVPDAGPLSLSPDGTRLRINGGDVIPFKSDRHIAAIRKLVAAYGAGERVPIGDLTDLGALNRLFGSEKWKLLSPYLKGHKGRWGFEP